MSPAKKLRHFRMPLPPTLNRYFKKEHRKRKAFRPLPTTPKLSLTADTDTDGKSITLQTFFWIWAL